MFLVKHMFQYLTSVRHNIRHSGFQQSGERSGIAYPTVREKASILSDMFMNVFNADFV